MIDKAELAKLALELAAAAGTFYVFFKSRAVISSEKSLLDYALSAAVYNPHELLSVLSKNEVDETNRDFLKVFHDDLIVRFMGFVEGRVSTKAPFTSYIDKLKEVIYSKLIIEPIYSNSSIPDPKDIVVKIKQKPEFELADASNLDKIVVRRNEAADVDSGLVQIGTIRRMGKFSLCVDIIYKLVTIVKVFFSVFRLNLNLKGVKIGKQTTEYGIILNQSLTLFGRMAYDKRNRLLTMDKPYFFLQDKGQFLRKIGEKLRRFQLYNLASVIFGIVFTLMVIRRIARLTKSLRQYFAELGKEIKFDKLKGLKNILVNDFYCVNCKQNAKSVIMKPCLHVCFCKSCFSEKRPAACPVCKRPVKDSVNIFIV